MGRSVQLVGPDLLTRFGLKGAEAAVVGGADEGQPAGRGQGRTQAAAAGVFLSPAARAIKNLIIVRIICIGPHSQKCSMT